MEVARRGARAAWRRGLAASLLVAGGPDAAGGWPWLAAAEHMPRGVRSRGAGGPLGTAEASLPAVNAP